MVSIVILNWNTKDLTKACIESIRKNTQDTPYEIILIDNGSTDGSELELPSLADRFLGNEKNLGFPVGCNQGISLATGDYVCLLNSDTTVTQGWLQGMKNLLDSDPSIGIVGPMGKTVYEPVEQRGEYGNIYPDRIVNRRPAFFCVLLHKKTMDEIGPLDERFSPGNYEDDDYCYRLRNAGYKFAIAGKAFVFHYPSSTFKSNADEIGNYSKIISRNAILFREKWGEFPRW